MLLGYTLTSNDRCYMAIPEASIEPTSFTKSLIYGAVRVKNASFRNLQPVIHFIYFFGEIRSRTLTAITIKGT
jgi:hypothetical protein